MLLKNVSRLLIEEKMIVNIPEELWLYSLTLSNQQTQKKNIASCIPSETVRTLVLV